jgi:hypothetical protein
MWEGIIVQILCALLALGSLVAAGWTVLTGQIADQGLDAVFLVVVCLLSAVMFSIIPLRAIRQGKWRDLLHSASRRSSKHERHSNA